MHDGTSVGDVIKMQTETLLHCADRSNERIKQSYWPLAVGWRAEKQALGVTQHGLLQIGF